MKKTYSTMITFLLILTVSISCITVNIFSASANDSLVICYCSNKDIEYEDEPASVIDSIYKDDTYHTTTYVYRGVCRSCGGEYPTLIYVDEEHTLVQGAWLEEHYHEGRYHHYLYEYGCSECTYTTERWDTLPCFDNGSGIGCIIPYKLPNIFEPY